MTGRSAIRESRKQSRIEAWADEQARRIRKERRDLDDREERRRIEQRRRFAARDVGPVVELEGGLPQ